ncbi:MAG: pilus assembly protein CpaF [Nocardioides sp.]|nr:pilus assembly protein CpaF [Nocardioides sp.]
MFIARDGRHELTSLILNAEQVRELVERMLSSSGRRLDISQPFVDAMLPGGHRLHVVLDGISRGFSAVNIRKFVARAHSLPDLVTLGTLDQQSAAFLDASVRAGLNIVVSGGTQAGIEQVISVVADVHRPRERFTAAKTLEEDLAAVVPAALVAPSSGI